MVTERLTGQDELQHSILSDRRILDHLQKGNIVIYPFSQDRLKTSSVDVTLGEWYFRPNNDHGLKHYNPWSKDHVQRVFGEPKRAKTAEEEFGNELPDGLRPEDKVIITYPGQMLLCHTQEFIGGKNGVTTMMKARSSIGRSDVVVCKCAGWGDVGFYNRWTMEVTSGGFGMGLPEILIVGEPVAQIAFFETGPTLGATYGETGKYQTSSNLDEMIETWDPHQMLPRLWKDREEK